MTDFRRVTDEYSVAPQIAPEDLAVAKEQGFVLVINNRPDGEAPGQPTSEVMEAAAKAEGLDYVYNPVRGLPPGEEQVAAQAAAIDKSDGPVLAYCRSGTRSITTWALGQEKAGIRDKGELTELGAAAGYDLGPILGG
jgi:uncharacterized protein (TIGR01244 family)